MARAERALHRRTALACAAAEDAGVPGRFRVWERGGLLAVLATDPALGFLATVSGVTPEKVSAAADLVDEPVWNGVRSAVVTDGLPMPGFVRTDDRLLATKRLRRHRAVSSEAVDADVFLNVLLAGFEARGMVARFMAAEHRLPELRRFLVREGEKPIAAAGMTIHDEVAVLGAASTLRAHRGRGAQLELLHRRLAVAAAEGCTLAVATARPESASAANLERAGFRLHRRQTWRKP
ncbi:GNAT family N-acetyltransferase [Amycolatopsis sp. MEPSY49]|uniref:GNAT family N-acetyltransferase n=1 Tax=Amycolatopsis sp. MEPSY49 TaxID=3151600 RepID=UPI003EF63339